MINALKFRLKKIVFDANLYRLGLVDYPSYEAKHKERLEILEALDYLGKDKWMQLKYW